MVSSSSCLDLRRILKVVLLTAMGSICCVRVIQTSAIMALGRALLRPSLMVWGEWSTGVPYLVMRRILSRFVGVAGVLVV